jgi:hypothetical protein
MAPRSVKKAKINGVTYHIMDGYLIDGLCQPKGGDPFIMVQAGMPPKRELETWVHESLHAACPDASEQWVTRRAKELTDLLWRLGYRRRGLVKASNNLPVTKDERDADYEDDHDDDDDKLEKAYTAAGFKFDNVSEEPPGDEYEPQDLPTTNPC